MQVFLDESGDMGWKFSAAYRQGGSSRFLCLAFLFVPAVLRKVPRSVMSGMYRRYGWKEEKKASQTTPAQKLEFAHALEGMMAANPPIRIDCIVAKKENVPAHIRTDANKLYNYMCGLVIPEYVKDVGTFRFIPDKRSIKVESGNCLSDYIQTKLWFDCGLQTVLINDPQESHKNYSLQFVDWVANSVWAHFEDGEFAVFQKMQRRIRVRRLYF